MDLNLTAQALLFVPLVIALTQLVKLYIDHKWAPLVSLAFGILCAWFVPVDTAPQFVLNGLVLGLTASGLYSGTKAVFS